MEGKIHVGNSQMCVTEHGIELAETSTSSPGSQRRTRQVPTVLVAREATYEEGYYGDPNLAANSRSNKGCKQSETTVEEEDLAKIAQFLFFVGCHEQKVQCII